MNSAQNQAILIARHIMRSLRLRPGQTELSVANWIKQELNAAGAKPAFDTIVASGLRSLDPHGQPTRKRLVKGEQVVIDLGANYQGYCSDLTRTFFIGRPTAKYQQLYNTVKIAQRLALKAVRAGAWCRLIDLQAREYIRRHCFRQCAQDEKKCSGDCFIHTTGHGVGRKVHQPPRISLKSRAKLKAGMVITIEPGIYIKGWGGIRIEDMVLVTKKGCKILT